MDNTLAAVYAFTDITVGAWYTDAVIWAVENGIAQGTGESTFSPNRICSSGEVLTLLWRAKGAPTPSISSPFSNVPRDAFYYEAALWAYENGMVSGTAFDSGAPCTRSMAVTYLWKLAGKPSGAPCGFDDVDSSAAYAQAVAWAVEQGLTNGTGSDTFSPDTACTRAQVMTFLYRDMAR